MAPMPAHAQAHAQAPAVPNGRRCLVPLLAACILPNH